MRRLKTSTFLFVALSLTQPALAESESEKPATSEATGEPTPSQAPTEPASAPPSAEPSEVHSQPTSQLSRDDICHLIESAASTVALPFEFLARLIWQESKFNPQAVSPAGAQGIAQFMPKTANGRGLADPFEPVAALQQSAEFLRELRDQFGNLGLAAAAYNAGPKRVQDWLAKRSTPPRETQDYVHIITGHAPDKWAAVEPPSLQEAARKSFQCGEIAKLVAQRRSLAVIERLAQLVVHRLSHSRGEAVPASAAQVHGQPRGETSAKLAAPPRSSARKGILAKRPAPPPSPTRSVQAARSLPQARVQPQRIIKITALSRHRPRIEIIAKGVAPPRNDSRIEKAAQVAAQPRQLPDAKRNADKASRGVQLAANNAAKFKEAAVSARPQKNTAAALQGRRPSKLGGAIPTRAAAARNVRVAANGHAGAEKSCSPAKGGGRKPCRAA